MMVEVELRSGTKGYGITDAGEPGCYIAEKQLA